MDHRSHLMQQAERFEPHNTPTSAAPDAAPSPELPAAPSIREAPVQRPLFHVLPPPDAPHTGESSLPTLAVGVKRSAADAGLDADAVPDGKRVKVSHAYDPDTKGFQESMPDAPGLAGGRKRTASDAGLDEDDLSARKRTCQRGPDGPDTQEEQYMMAAVAASHTQGQTPEQDRGAVVPFAVDQPAQRRPGKISRAIWRNAYEGNLPAIQAWLKTPGIDINANGEEHGNGWYPFFGNALEAAVSGNAVAVVRALLAIPGIDPAAKNWNGLPVLQYASETTAPLIIEALLTMQGFKVSARDFLDRHQGFAAAAEAGDLAQVRSLLADNPWLDINFELTSETALKLLARSEHFKKEKVLRISPGTIVGLNASRSLRTFAVENGHLHLFRFMLGKLDFDPNGYGYFGPYLISAATKGHFPIVQALLATPGIEADVSTHSGSTALLAAIRNDHHQVAIVLAALPWSKHRGDYGTALMMAAQKGNLPLVRMLLAEHKIDVNVRDQKGFTPLMLAAYRGHLAIVQALLAMPEIDVNLVRGGWDYGHCDISMAGDDLLKKAVNAASSALSLAKLADRKQIIDALLTMPVSPEFVHRELYESLRASSPPARAKPVSKPAPSPEEKYCFLRQIVHPGPGTDLAVTSMAPHRDRLDAQRAPWLEQQCMAVILGTCAASDVPFLLQSTIPLPAWCQSSLANAIALGFTVGHYRNAPAPLWQPLLQTRAWLAGLALGARQSRQDAIELDAGISGQLESMGLWNGFLNALEELRQMKAGLDDGHLDKLTMLGYAARDGDLSMIKTFIGMGANIHLRSPNGDAPILIAAKAGQWAACAELVSLGAMPLMVDSKGYPALYYIASAFANSNSATLALASLIRYLRLKNVRFDIPALNQFYIVSSGVNCRNIVNSSDEDCVILKDEMEDELEEISLPVLVSETLVSNPESWIRFGKAIYGIADEPLPVTAVTPSSSVQQSMSLKTHVQAMVQSVNAQATLAAWLDEDPQRLHWQDPDNGQGLLHLAAAHQHLGLVRLLLDRGIARTHVDHAGRSAAQMLPADYMSSYTPAAKRIASLLR
jgi:ankyrin repeat protein